MNRVRIGQGQRAGNDARDDQEFEGVDGERLDAIDLFGGAHVGEDRADAGADAARHQQRGNQRTNLEEERKRLDRGNHGGGAEHDQRTARMQRHDRAERKAGGNHQRKGFRADLGELPDDLRAFERAAKRVDDGPKTEETDLTGDFEDVSQVEHLFRSLRMAPLPMPPAHRLLRGDGSATFHPSRAAASRKNTREYEPSRSLTRM